MDLLRLSVLLGLVGLVLACSGSGEGTGGDDGSTGDGSDGDTPSDGDGADGDVKPDGSDVKPDGSDVKPDGSDLDSGPVERTDGGPGDGSGDGSGDGGPSTPPPEPNLECFSFTCQFEFDEPNCGFEDKSIPIEGNEPFQPRTGKFKNSVTGIPSGDGDSSGYMATYLKSGSSAELHSRGNVTMAKERIIRLRFYEAVSGHRLSACCGTDAYCPFNSDEGVAVYAFRQWQTAEFICPKGTDKLILKCEALDKHEGACGIDNIDIVDADGNSLCYEQPALSDPPPAPAPVRIRRSRLRR